MWQLIKGLFARKPNPELGTVLDDTPDYLVIADGEGEEAIIPKPARGGIAVDVVDGKIDVQPITARFTARIRKDKRGRWRISIHDVNDGGEAILISAGNGFMLWNDARRTVKALNRWGVEYTPETCHDSVAVDKIAGV